MAEHVQHIRNKENNAHLLLQQPAFQPWVVLDELLIAQAVLHCRGYVTHPNDCRSARCTSASYETILHRLLQLIQQMEASDQYANAGLGLAAWGDGIRGWPRMVEDDSAVAVATTSLPGRGPKQRGWGDGG